MAVTIEAPRIRLLLDEICGKLGGTWLLGGGSLVLLEFDPQRVAHNVDLVPVNVKSGILQLQRQVDSLAHPLGFTTAQVRALALGYLEEVPDWIRYSVELKSYSLGRLIRPDLTLFTYLKLRRGTEKDIADVRAAVAKLGRREFNVAAFASWAQSRADMLHRYQDTRAALGLPLAP
jgi:hypothetical protein